ncbi:Acryloyl-CoA reductase (NADH) [Paraconexibacter sp. AEG42_29]|uniref:Acryloyl-CoA reductase (NADH) n=1 Tax=Paraconexibacter sp. AEG42_29 TaxID=2997339 RepID=A0AAU7B3H2_9ACTN
MSIALAGRLPGLFEDEHEALRESFARFLAERVTAETYAGWGEPDGAGVPPSFFAAAAEHGFVAMAIPEEHGGSGVEDPRFGAVLVEAAMHAGLPAVALALGQHNDVCVPALLSCAQDPVLLTRLAGGRSLTALAGPGALTARRSGDVWVLDGSCPAVLGGVHADVLVVIADAGEHAHAFVIDAEVGGLTRAPGVARFGLQAADFADVVLDGVRVPAQRCLGPDTAESVLVGQRLTLAVAAVAGARAALDWTVQYVHERRAFGQPLAAFENTRITLGDVAAELTATSAFVDSCLLAHAAGALGAATAAAAKLRATELQARAVDAGVQLHGGYGYMSEYPIARAYADARMLRMFGGSSEHLRAVIAQAAGV